MLEFGKLCSSAFGSHYVITVLLSVATVQLGSTRLGFTGFDPWHSGSQAQAIRALTGLCRLRLMFDLAMAPCLYLEVTTILCLITSRFELISVE